MALTLVPHVRSADALGPLFYVADEGNGAVRVGAADTGAAATLQLPPGEAPPPPVPPPSTRGWPAGAPAASLPPSRT